MQLHLIDEVMSLYLGIVVMINSQLADIKVKQFYVK